MSISQPTKLSYEFGPYRLDVIERQLLREGREVPLTPRVFSLLLLLVQHPGRILDKDEMMSQLWPEEMVEESNLTRHISRLRKALNEQPSDLQYIETIPWRGYRFMADVREVRDEAGPIRVERTYFRDAIEDRGGAVGSQENGQAVTSPPLTPLQEPGETATISAVAGRPAASESIARPLGWRAILSGTLLIAATLTTCYVMWSQTNPGVAVPVLKMNKLTNSGHSKLAAISPDGRYVAYVTEEMGEQSLWIRLISSAGDAQIVPPSDVDYGGLTFSHDSSYLYYIIREKTDRNSTLYQVSVIGGAGRKLKTGVDSPVSFSADGKRMAFVREYPDEGKSSLMLAATDGSGEIELASRRLPNYYDYPVWSPDGKMIACTAINYSSDRQHVQVIAVNVLNGKEASIGSQSWPFAFKPQWLSDGRGLIISALVGSTTQIFLLSYPNGETNRITNDLNTYIGASLTANSHALVTVEQTILSGLWITPIGDVRHARQLTKAGDLSHGQPRWRPDGKLVYAANTNGNWDIWEISAEGNGRKQLTFSPDIDQQPSASADGKYIVFASIRNGTCDIWRMDADGANLKQLTFGGGNVNPWFTPDGKWVAYMSVDSAQPYTIYRVPINGGNAVQLTDASCRSPAISPDGRRLACYHIEWSLSTQIPSTTIAVISLDGGAPKKFFSIPVTVYQRGGIRWTPDGKSISYIDSRDGSSNVWSQSLTGGPAKKLTDFRGDRMFAFDWSRDGTELACVRGIFKQDVVMMNDFSMPR